MAVPTTSRWSWPLTRSPRSDRCRPCRTTGKGCREPARSLPPLRINRLVHGGFCISPQKGSFQSRGCKSYRKRNAFRTYVLRRRNWRKTGLRPVVAYLDGFATRAFWLTSRTHFVLLQPEMERPHPRVILQLGRSLSHAKAPQGRHACREGRHPPASSHRPGGLIPKSGDPEELAR
jgi:hypothetical protein